MPNVKAVPSRVASARTRHLEKLPSATDRPSALKLMMRRQKRRLRPFTWAGVLLVVVGGGALVTHRAMGEVDVFRERLGTMTAFAGLRVQQVEIKGRVNAPEPLINAAVGVLTGQPILGFSVSEARARLESLAWIENATVSRRLPGTIVVDLTERRPFAVWQNQGRFTLIDRDGRAVPDQDTGAFSGLPLVVGQGAPAGAAALIDNVQKYPAIRSHLVAAVRVGERRWNLHMNNGGDVMLPEGHEDVALGRLAALQQDHALLDRPLTVIDLRLPDRLVVRPQIAAADPVPPVPAPARETR